jgi:hypothetical protein
LDLRHFSDRTIFVSRLVQGKPRNRSQEDATVRIRRGGLAPEHIDVAAF